MLPSLGQKPMCGFLIPSLKSLRNSTTVDGNRKKETGPASHPCDTRSTALVQEDVERAL